MNPEEEINPGENEAGSPESDAPVETDTDTGEEVTPAPETEEGAEETPEQ